MGERTDVRRWWEHGRRTALPNPMALRHLARLSSTRQQAVVQRGIAWRTPLASSIRCCLCLGKNALAVAADARHISVLRVS